MFFFIMVQFQFCFITFNRTEIIIDDITNYCGGEAERQPFQQVLESLADYGCCDNSELPAAGSSVNDGKQGPTFFSRKCNS